jgi:hypothetical protein
LFYYPYRPHEAFGVVMDDYNFAGSDPLAGTPLCVEVAQLHEIIFDESGANFADIFLSGSIHFGEFSDSRIRNK